MMRTSESGSIQISRLDQHIAPRQRGWQHRTAENHTMTLFNIFDLVALAVFIAAWSGYAILLEWTPHGHARASTRA